jgi:hypothetical protein
VNHVRNGGEKKRGSGIPVSEWYRSKSTTRLNHGRGRSVDHDDDDEVDNDASSSCSTLSDEDTTPHVSRTNSYGRAEDSSVTFTTRSFPNEAYDIYLRDDHLGTDAFIITPSTPNAFVGSGINVNSADTPPGYEETISRQRLLKHYNRSSSFVVTPTQGKPVRLVYDEALINSAPPLPPKTERPPLPPKQRIRLSVDDTYVNNVELQLQQQRHQQQLSQRQLFVDDRDEMLLVYPSYSTAGARIHVTHTPDHRAQVKHQQSAPQLPPKEVVSRRSPPSSSDMSDAGSSTNGNPQKKRSVSRTKITATTQTRTMRNAETQTDETDFFLLYEDDDGLLDDDFDDNEEGVDVDGLPNDGNNNSNLNSPWTSRSRHDTKQDDRRSESNRSLSPECFPSFNRMTLDGPEYQRPMSAHQLSELRHAGRRRLEPAQSVPLPLTSTASPSTDPIIQGEINWSVSRLRTLFNQGQHSPNSSSSTNSSSNSNSSSSCYGGGGGSSTGGRFTNGEYIDSPSANMKAARQVMLERSHHNGGNNVLARQDLFLGGSSPVDKDQDSDQESYV